MQMKEPIYFSTGIGDFGLYEGMSIIMISIVSRHDAACNGNLQEIRQLDQPKTEKDLSCEVLNFIRG
jgi:hypothetical protein